MGKELTGPIIDVEKLSLHRGGREVLRDISFQTFAGEFLCVTGPNGAGKTTLLQCLLRLLKMDEGRISIAGRNIRDYSQRDLAKQLAYVPQADGRSPIFPVEEFVLLGRYPHRQGLFVETDHDRSVARDVLALTGTSAFAQRNIYSLSGGERQKVFIAAALAQEAPILLLDEPTVFLDPRHQSEICRLLRQLNRERKVTVVMVTHDIHMVSLCADKVLALRDGAEAYFGPAREFLQPDVLEDLYEIPFDVSEPSAEGSTRVFHRSLT